MSGLIIISTQFMCMKLNLLGLALILNSSNIRAADYERSLN